MSRRSQSDNLRRKARKKLSVLILRDGLNCCWCGVKTVPDAHNAREQTTVEHVKPLSMGGTNDLSNLKLACARCNNARGSWASAVWPSLEPNEHFATALAKALAAA